MDKQIIISKSFTFEASHVLPRHPGKCRRLHGHSWKLTVSVIGYVDPNTGFVCDYGDLAKVVREQIIDRVDHQHLGMGDMRSDFDLREPYLAPFGPEFYPSSENLVNAFAGILWRPVQNLPNNPTLYEIALEETCTSKAIWRKEK